MTELYYFDNSATTLKKPAAVAEAVYHAIADGQLGNPARGSHTVSLNALRLTETLRQKTAALFGVPDAANVAFTSNATASLNMVLKGLLKPADHIITTVTEHNAVLRPLYQLEEQGAALSFVGVDEFGTLRYSDFEQLVASRYPCSRGQPCFECHRQCGRSGADRRFLPGAQSYFDCRRLPERRRPRH